MNYHNITKDDMLNGDGIRVVLWVAGCEHHCDECQNPETWNYKSGIPFDTNALEEIEAELKKDYVSGITLSGGDPFAPQNREEIYELVRWLKYFYPSKTIWVYTGYKIEELAFYADGTSVFGYPAILHFIDVLVDGKYEKDKRDVNLKWRGSSNQRVIDVKKSYKEGKIVLHCD